MAQLNSTYVKSALAELRRTGAKGFGSEEHGFRLNPPVSEVEVLSLEKQHQVRLPEEYRSFLTLIGDGGAGPAHGIFRLGEIDHNFGYCKWNDRPGAIGNLSMQFRFNEPWNDLEGLPSAELLDLDEDDYWKQQKSFENRYWGSDPIDGCIPICHMGCALRILLVLSGPQAGHLWRDSRADLAGLAPILFPNGEPATFSKWYEDWLQACLTSPPLVQA